MITEMDLSPNLLNNIEPEYRSIIIDFCNSFYSVYGHILSKEKLIDKINLLSGVSKSKTECVENEIAKHIFERNPFNTRIYVNDNMSFSNDELKIAIYHELIHHVSLQHYIDNLGRNRYYEGVQQIGPMLDEVLTESMAVNLINFEGINLDRKKVVKKFNKLDMTEEYIGVGGTGYSIVANLGQVYIDIFGDEILNAKFNDLGLFYQNNFSKINNVINGSFLKVSSQIEETFETEEKDNLYACYLTAIDVFENLEIEKFNNSDFSLYQYLYDSSKLLQYLPKIENGTQVDAQINYNMVDIFRKRIKQLDDKIISKYFSNDNQNFNKFEDYNNVINTLRDNINSLNETDLENLNFGKIPQYTHSNSYCLVITAGAHKFLSFSTHSADLNVDVDNYSYGSRQFKELSAEDKLSIFGEKQPFDKVSYATMYTTRGVYTVLETEKGIIPLTDNEGLVPIELYDVEYINNNGLGINNRSK